LAETSTAPAGVLPGDRPRSLFHFRCLVAGYTVSSFGNHLNLVALNLFAYLTTGSALQTGLLMALRLATGLVTGLAAATVVSRFTRKRVMIAADLAQATAMVVLALAPVSAAAGLLYCAAVVTGAAATLSSVSLRGGVPEMVGQERRARANALLVSARSLAMITGLASAGVIVAATGFTTAFLIDAATFVISAVNLSWLPLPVSRHGGATDRPAAKAVPPAPGWTATLAVGRGALRAAPILVAMIGVRAGDGFGSSSHLVGLPVYAAEVRPADPASFLSQVWTAWAIGSLLTQQVVGRLASRGAGVLGERSFAAGTAVMSAMFIVVFSGLPPVLLLTVALCAGLADGLTETAYLSRLQQVDDGRRDAVFGVVAAAESTGLGLGMVVSASLLDRFGAPTTVALMHGSVVALALVMLALTAVAGLRRRDRRRPTGKETP
jgi:predicted MFS family arabinose efflux permease